MTAPVIVCDVDDTLYLERDYVWSGFSAVNELVALSFGVDGFLDAAWTLFQSGRRGTIFNEALSRVGVDASPAVIRQLVECYRTHPPDIELLPDAAVALEDWESSECLVAIITDGPVESQCAKIRALGLEGRAYPIIITEEFGPAWRKPSELAFSEIRRELGDPLRRYVYAADNPIKDFAAPKALGWWTFRVRREQSLHESIESGCDVDHEAVGLRGLLDWLSVC